MGGKLPSQPLPLFSKTEMSSPTRRQTPRFFNLRKHAHEGFFHTRRRKPHENALEAKKRRKKISHASNLVSGLQGLWSKVCKRVAGCKGQNGSRLMLFSAFLPHSGCEHGVSKREDRVPEPRIGERRVPKPQSLNIVLNV